MPVSRGSDEGWHSSISIARSGVRVARHCRRTSACRWRRRIVYDDNACASSDNDGRGEDVASIVSDIDKSHSVGSTSFASNEKSDTIDAGVSGPSQYPSSSTVDESDGEAISLGGGEGERISVSFSACDCSCAVNAVMEGCRGADLYASNLESRRAEGPWRECGVEHRDVNGEISADVHSSMLS